MISFAIIAVLLILGALAIKLNHLRHRVFLIILISVLLFFYITMVVVNNKNELDFTSSEGVIHAVKIYSGWLANSFNNMIAITGNAIRMDWTNTNASVINRTKAEKQDSQTDMTKKFPGYRP